MFNLWKLLALFYSLFACRVEPDPEDPQDPEDPEPEDPEDPQDPEDPEPEDPEDPEDPPEPAPRQLSRAERRFQALSTRAQEAEEALRRVQADLEAVRRPQGQAQPTPEQVLWQQEEAILNDPKAEDWQKYAVNATRAARSANQTSQQAMRHAEDIADQTKFAAIAATKPKVYAQYKDRVEKMLGDMRKNGNNAPREKLLALLIGEDMLASKLVTKSKAKGDADPAPTRQVRSDVNDKSTRMSDIEKLEKRYENIRI